MKIILPISLVVVVFKGSSGIAVEVSSNSVVEVSSAVDEILVHF